MRAPDVNQTDGREVGAVDCHLELDARPPFGHCPSTFGDDSWKSDACLVSPVPFAPGVFERTCAGYRSRTIDFGTHRWTCYYDPVSLAVVGGEFIDDTNDLCNFTTFILVAGDVPDGGSCSARVMLDMPCGPIDSGGQDATGQ